MEAIFGDEVDVTWSSSIMILVCVGDLSKMWAPSAYSFRTMGPSTGFRVHRTHWDYHRIGYVSPILWQVWARSYHIVGSRASGLCVR